MPNVFILVTLIVMLIACVPPFYLRIFSYIVKKSLIMLCTCICMCIVIDINIYQPHRFEICMYEHGEGHVISHCSMCIGLHVSGMLV